MEGKMVSRLKRIVGVVAVGTDAAFLGWLVYLPLLRLLIQNRVPFDDGPVANATVAVVLTTIIAGLFCAVIYIAYAKADTFIESIGAVIVVVLLYHGIFPAIVEHRLVRIQEQVTMESDNLRSARLQTERNNALQKKFAALASEQDAMLDRALIHEIAQARASRHPRLDADCKLRVTRWLSTWATCNKSNCSPKVAASESARAESDRVLLRTGGHELLGAIESQGIKVDRDYAAKVKSTVAAQKAALIEESKQGAALPAVAPVPGVRLDYPLNIAVGLMLTLISAYLRRAR